MQIASEQAPVGLDVGGLGTMPPTDPLHVSVKPWARSSMAEQLTLNQRVDSSSLSGLTTTLRTKRPSGFLEGRSDSVPYPSVPLSAGGRRPRMTSVRSAALPSIASVRWPYTLAVVVMLAWPRIRETTASSSPCASLSVSGVRSRRAASERDGRLVKEVSPDLETCGSYRPLGVVDETCVKFRGRSLRGEWQLELSR